MEANFSCGCGEVLSLTCVLADAGELEQLLKRHGWVFGPRIVDKDGKEYVNHACSVECYNRRVRALFEGHASVRWWRDLHGFEGDPPPCTCQLVERDDGLLVEERATDCPWHEWSEQWRRDRNAEQERLLAEWKDVPVGTLVRERDNVSGRRGPGRTAGRAKLVEWTFGGYKAAMIPVEGWSPHPYLEDLTIVEDDG